MKTVRDRQQLLPFALQKETRVAHVILRNAWANEGFADDLSAGLAARCDSVDVLEDPGPAKLLQVAKSGEYDLIVCSVSEAPCWGLNTSRLSGPVARNMMNGWMRYQTPTVFVVYDSVSFGKTFVSSTDTLIETYGVTEYTADAVLKRITGE